MITGKVTNNNGQSLPGANVYPSDAAGNLIGTIGAQTDANGNYVLPTVYSGYISASFIGHTTKTVVITGLVQNFALQAGVDIPGPTIISPKNAGKGAIAYIFVGTALAIALLSK